MNPAFVVAMHAADAIKTYLARLEAADVEGLAALFAEDADIHSPLFGCMRPRPFFDKLSAASHQSTIDAPQIFVGTTGRRLICLFTYHWVLKSGAQVRFPCADVFDFDDAGRIRSLTILYDTGPVRQVIGEQSA